MAISIGLGLGARAFVGAFPPPVPVAGTDLLLYREATTARPAGAVTVSTDANRFKRAQSGFVRVSGTSDPRTVYDSTGAYLGNYVQGADTYLSAPWDDTAAPHTSSDPAYLTTSTGGTIAYAGAHSEADIFGTTGKGVVITQTATQNGFHTASNVAATSVAVGDVIRAHAIVAIGSATISGQVTLRIGSSTHVFSHDSSGVITGQTEAWTSRRAGFYDMGTINGKRWWYLFVDLKATSTSNLAVGIGFGNVTADAGKKYHICELMIQKNPATAPAAIPVCRANTTFTADVINSGITGNIGFILSGAALARSQGSMGGGLTTPGIVIGQPYEPICTRVDVVSVTEASDRSGIMPNVNQQIYGRAWTTPTNLSLTLGPGWFARDWYKGNASGEAATNLVVRSVFQTREDLHAIIGNVATSQVYVTGAVDIDRVILMCGGDTRTKHIEQSDVLTGTGASFFFIAGTNLAVTNSLVMGSTLHPTRARHQVQQDDTDAKRVYMGELVLQSNSGGAISVNGTRTHNLARTAFTATANTTPVTYDTDDFCATAFWMDMLFITRGTVNSWTGDRMFGALATSRIDMFLCQTERPIRISSDAGATWADLSPSFDEKTMPHGFLAEHIGTWDFDTQTFTSAPDATKTCRVRYWQSGSISSPIVNKPGFQWIGSQMDLGTHSRVPNAGDVFRIKNGSQWIDVTYQGGYWASGGYVRYTGASIDNAANMTHLVSNDFIQINRQFVFATTTNTFDGCVFLGPKGGFFLTGNTSLGATDSQLDAFTIQNSILMMESTNALRFDYSAKVGSVCNVSNTLVIEAATDFTYNDGNGYTLTIGAAGARNTLALGSNVTVITSTTNGTGGLLLQASASSTGSLRTIYNGRRSNYNQWSTPDAAVPQYFPAEFYNVTQGRAKLPALGREFDFDLTAFADTDAGFGARAAIAAAKGTHARWNAMIAQMKGWFHKTPDLVATVANTASIGTDLGAATGTIDRRYGGDNARLFEVVAGRLVTRAALTGLNTVVMMRTTTGQLLIVDVTT